MSKTPYGAFETAKFSYNFISDNFRYLLHVLKPLLPVIVLNAWLSGAMEKGENADNPALLSLLVALTAIASFIYTTAFVITWHRSVILGPNNAQRANPLKFTKSEWGFLFAGFIIFIALLASGTVFGFILGLLGLPVPVTILLGVAFFIAMIAYATRLYLYFPAKATGADITFRDAMTIGKGLTGKILTSFFIATLPLIAMAIVIIPVAMLVLTLIIGLPETLTERLIFSLLISPFKVFIEIIGAAAMVGVLSRYYMWASYKHLS